MSEAGRRPWLVAIAYTDLPSDARVIRESREELARGARVTLVVPRSPSGVVPAGLAGAEVVWLPVEQERGGTTVGGQLRFMRALARWRAAQAQRPDIVHVHNMPDYLYWSVARWHAAGARVVIDVHDIMSDLAVHRFRGARRAIAVPMLRAAERMVWRRADHVITVHDAYRELIIGRGVRPDRVTSVLNAPDPELFHPGRRRAPDPARFVAVFHGTVTERSGVVNAVRAMAEVSRAVPHAELRIVGTGNARAQVQRAIAELPPGARVSFDDRYVPLEEVVTVIADADVGVVPNERSRYTRHMLPVKLTEYAALGIPSLATRLPLTEQYVGDDGALLLDDADPASIAAGLVQLARDAGLRERLARGARAFAERHAWPRYGAALARAVGLA